MSFVTLRTGLAIWELVYYSVALAGSIWVSLRHGFSKGSGWIFLTIFSCIRVIGCSSQIAAVAGGSGTAQTIATVTAFLGLSPLLLALLGILSRVYYSMLQTPGSLLFNMVIVRAVQIPASIALILCIVGATSADTPEDIGTQDTVKAGVILYLVVLIFLGLLVIGAAIAHRQKAAQMESLLWKVSAASLPFLLIRVIYSILSVFSRQYQTWSATSPTSSIIVELFMARIEEMIIILLLLWAGFKSPAIPDNDMESNRNRRTKLSYRAGRGDFGGGKLGLASLAVAAGSNVLHKTARQPRYQSRY